MEEKCNLPFCSLWTYLKQLGTPEESGKMNLKHHLQHCRENFRYFVGVFAPAGRSRDKNRRNVYPPFWIWLFGTDKHVGCHHFLSMLWNLNWAILWINKIPSLNGHVLFSLYTSYSRVNWMAHLWIKHLFTNKYCLICDLIPPSYWLLGVSVKVWQE